MKSHLRLQISGKDLLLPSDFSMDIEEQNPLFNDAEMFSYPVSIPLKGNRVIVKNVDDFNSDERVSHLEHLPMRCWVDGFPFRSGLAVVQEDEEVEDSVSINMDASNQSFSDLISDLKCSDIPVKDEIVIGEKVGNVSASVDYTYHIKIDIKHRSDDHFERSGNHVTCSFDPQAMGFSYPAVCVVEDEQTQVAKQAELRTYPRNNTLVIPEVKTSYINTSAAYGETLPNGKPAYYANARVCYKHYDIGDDGATSSSTVKQADSTGQYEDIYPYWVLDANRPQSGICFYVLYFLDCLFAYLGMEFDKSALLKIEDFKHLVFFTTKCAYTTRKATQYYKDESQPFFKNLNSINTWLASRGCGGEIYIEAPEDKNMDEITIYWKELGKEFHYKAGEDRCRSINIHSWFNGDPVVQADLYEMLASGENFPDESVQTVLDSLSAAFGVKFDYDYEQKKVTANLLRNVFRNKGNSEVNHFMGTVLTMNPMTEKILGFRMRYSQEQDEKEQLQNVKDAASGINLNYETDYNYIDYPEDKTEYEKTYTDFFRTLSPTDKTVYIDRHTGNAYRIKIDGDAKTMNDFHPVLFEVGGYKGVEIGDCSVQNEDFIEDNSISFEPVIFNDVNYYNEKKAVSNNSETTSDNGDYVRATSVPSSILAAYVDEDMEHEFVEQYIKNAMGDNYVSIYATEKLKLVESYNPSNTDNGESPLQSHNWGVALAVMRGGGTDMTFQNFDYDYDGFGTGKWRTVAGKYAMSSDSMDAFGNDYDYNGVSEGIGKGERFSLKIRAFKDVDWAREKNISLCDSDEIDPESKEITRKVKSRGLFDTFYSEYAHFLMTRKKFKVKALATPAQLTEIRNHWREVWEFGGKKGFVNKVNYSLTAAEGVKDVEIEFFSF